MPLLPPKPARRRRAGRPAEARSCSELRACVGRMRDEAPPETAVMMGLDARVRAVEAPREIGRDALACGDLEQKEKSMLNFLTGALAFSAPPSMATRRDMLLGAGSAAAALVTFPNVAGAEYFGEPPPKVTGAEYKEKLQQAKDFKYAARPVAGNEDAVFKAAEAKRVAAQNLKPGSKSKEENPADTIARLGLKMAS